MTWGVTESEVSKGTRTKAFTKFIPGSGSKIHSPSDILGSFLLETEEKKVRPRDEGSRQSTGGSLTSLIESGRYKLVKPISAAHHRSMERVRGRRIMPEA
jgi:hypothetical protein